MGPSEPSLDDRRRCDDRGVSSRFRDRAGEESGMVRASTVIGIGIALFLGYLLLAAINGDTAKFGSVPVPGKQQVELPKGDIDIYYSEGVDPDEGIPLIVPDDLTYVITDADGIAVEVQSRGAEAKSTGDGLTRLIGYLKAPEEGSYTVTTESSQTLQRINPSVTFGQGPLASVGQRLKDSFETLRGPLGIALLVVLVVLFLLPRFRSARRRHSYRDR